MEGKEQLITRRDFIGRAAATAVTATVGGLAINSADFTGALAASQKGTEKVRRARVILVRNRDVIDKEDGINGKILDKMLDMAVKELFSTPDAATAWSRIIKTADIVGIKSNVWQFLPTPPELEEIIRKKVKEAGAPDKNIHTDDRGALKKLAKCSALINVRPLRTHHWSGIGGCIKNYIQFAESPPSYHGDSCASLGSIWNLPIVKGKTRLNVLVALTPQFYGRGPHHFDRRYVWSYCGLMVSQDPVALDALGDQLLKKKRVLHFGENKPVTPTKHIQEADHTYHIGVSSMKQIELITMGWKEDLIL